MRIIAGSKRGMKLRPPKGDGTRPVTDRVKESVFDVLFNYGYPESARVADVFCGTGSFGLEAVSRGAEFALFVDKDFKVIEILKKNIERAKFVEQSKVIRGNAFKIGAPVDIDAEKFGLVFVDPPYALSRDASEGSQLGKMLVVMNQQVINDGLVVVRTEQRVELLDEYGSLKAVDRRKWGKIGVVIYKNSCE